MEMFDLNTISTLIGNIGFPIFMCVYMTNYCTKIVEKNTTVVSELKDTIQKLIERLD